MVVHLVLVPPSSFHSLQDRQCHTKRMDERMNEQKGTRCFGIWSLYSWSLRKPLELRPLMDERCKGDAAATHDDVDVEICDKAEGFLQKKKLDF